VTTTPLGDPRFGSPPTPDTVGRAVRRPGVGSPAVAATPDAVPGSMYDEIGPDAFTRLVDAFYAGVAADPRLRPMYPEADLRPAAERLRLFLVQYWGGPRTYSDQRGHPRLRMRHMPFAIGPVQRDAWLEHMRTALDTLALTPEQDAEMWTYLVTAAHAMVNRFDDVPQPTGTTLPTV
jgi:hemoglobin